MRYDRTVIGYHGCDAAVADRLLRGEPFHCSENSYDWLGSGVYFWEYGPDRALRFARDQQRRGKVAEPAVVGALVQLGNCFDLLDTRFTLALGHAYERYQGGHARTGQPLPVNSGGNPDRKLRRRDCWMLNQYLEESERDGRAYDTVRCCFLEGDRAFPGSGIFIESHIQIAVRNPACILGVFGQHWIREGRHRVRSRGPRHEGGHHDGQTQESQNPEHECLEGQHWEDQDLEGQNLAVQNGVRKSLAVQKPEGRTPEARSPREQVLHARRERLSAGSRDTRRAAGGAR
jgi:hypothetical protein